MIVTSYCRDDESLYLIKNGCDKICYTGIDNA